jgi:hypothetical protein
MKVIKSMLLLTLVGVPAIAAVSYDHAWPDAFGLLGQTATAAEKVSVQPKDAARLAPFADDNDDQAILLIKLAQASRQPDLAPAAIRTAQAFLPPPAFGDPPVPHGAFGPFSPPAVMGPPLRPLTRSVCEDRINSEAAMVGYLKSKLRLQPNQREAWQKLENAAQAAIEKLHAACESLPIEASAPAPLPDMMEIVEAEMSARLELLRATREPLLALFATLTPEQRRTLQPPVPLPPRL